MNRFTNIYFAFKEELNIFLSLTIGIFLFILFFEPFPTDRFDFNNTLIFVAGLGGIVFIFTVAARLIFRWLIDEKKLKLDSSFISNIGGFLLVAFISVAFAFYLRYVGGVPITFHIMFKVILIALIPPVVLRLNHIFQELKQQNSELKIKAAINQNEIKKFKEDYQNKTIEFVSEYNNEKLKLVIADIVFIKSADNYVEVVHKNNNGVQKKLLRNTLKYIEQQVQPFSNFVRCHRTSIVNVYYIDKLTKKYNNFQLSIKGTHEQLPVSRQYVLKVKERLHGDRDE